MNTQELVEHYGKMNQCKGKLDAINNIALPAIERIKEKLNEKNPDNIFRSLQEHMAQQDQDIKASFEIYEQQMKQRDDNARLFCVNKTNDELKAWLADQPVAYNLWRDANHETLVELAFNVYE